MLAIDTSSAICSVALKTSKGEIDVISCDKINNHSEELISLVDKLLAKHSLAMSDIKELVIATGPGSFVGIRVGITFVKALSLVYPNLNIYAPNWLEILLEKNREAEYAALYFNVKDAYLMKRGGSDISIVSGELLSDLAAQVAVKDDACNARELALYGCHEKYKVSDSSSIEACYVKTEKDLLTTPKSF